MHEAQLKECHPTTRSLHVAQTPDTVNPSYHTTPNFPLAVLCVCRWGFLSRAGLHDKSQLCRQIEKYADVYTSRVCNLLRYTPYMYFRSPTQSMAHDRGLTEYSLKIPANEGLNNAGVVLNQDVDAEGVFEGANVRGGALWSQLGDDVPHR